MKEFLRGIAFSLCLILAAFLPGCGKLDTIPVTLRSAPLSEAPPRRDTPALRIGIAPVTSPRESFSVYAQLQSYLENRLNRPVIILHRSTYAEINALLREGYCDIAFVCGYPYVQGKHDFGMEALVTPVLDGQTASYSYVIIPARSSRTSLTELRGSVFAFSDPLSNAGRLAPAFAVSQIADGERAETFFRHVVFTYGQERSIRAVAAAAVDGAAVDSLVFERMVAREPSLRNAIRVVERLGPFGMPPIVVRPALEPQVKETVRRTLLRMHQDAQGRRVLQQLGFERFSAPDDRAYESIRKMAQVLGEWP